MIRVNRAISQPHELDPRENTYLNSIECINKLNDGRRSYSFNTQLQAFSDVDFCDFHECLMSIYVF